MRPHTSYLICATPRSGSFLLCEALINTGLAGYPGEYFWQGDEPGWKERWHVSGYADYVAKAIEQGSTRNGVFGAKIMWGWSGEHLPAPEQDPVFDFDEIDALRREIIAHDAAWQNYFAACGVTPYTVVYEDLLPAYEETALRILDYLNVPVPTNLVFGPRRMKKQADAVSEEWVQRYYHRKGEVGPR